MRAFLKIPFIFCACAIAWSCNVVCAAEKISIKELLENSSRYNNKRVVVEGEAVGSVLRAKKGTCWININDGTQTIGVNILCRELDKVSFTGRYKRKGDKLRVEGVFLDSGNERFYEAGILGIGVSVVESGYASVDIVSEKKLRIARLLGIISLLLSLAYIIKKGLSRNERKDTTFS